MWKLSVFVIMLCLTVSCQNSQKNNHNHTSFSNSSNTQSQSSRTMLPQITLEKMPSSVEEFKALQKTFATQPQGGAAMMIVALLIYSENQELGQQIVTLATNESRLVDGSKGYENKQIANIELQRLRDRVAGKAYVIKSYFHGAYPSNGYQASTPHKIDTFLNPHSSLGGGKMKVFIMCNGADNPRPITLKKSGDFWKADEWSSLLLGVKKPMS
jgi:hypothetical protein